MEENERIAALNKLREPFPADCISKLPKPSKAQTEALRKEPKSGIRCKICGTWHHPNAVHLDYVGHAALTKRLLEVDPLWNWEPLALDGGLPKYDEDGGLWGKLTVCGMTRIGYGHADGDDCGDKTKEIIGDFLRNAAMRFGCALELWFKGDLPQETFGDPQKQAEEQPATRLITKSQVGQFQKEFVARGVNKAKFLAVAKVNSLEEISASNFAALMAQVCLKPPLRDQEIQPNTPTTAESKTEEVVMCSCPEAPGMQIPFSECSQSQCHNGCPEWNRINGGAKK